MAGATVFCGVILAGLDILLRSDIKQNERKIQDTHIDVLLAKAEISGMKEDMTIVKSNVSDLETNLTATKTELLDQIKLQRRMAGFSPFSFPINSNRPGAAGA